MIIPCCYNITNSWANITFKRMEGQKGKKALAHSLSYCTFFNLELFVLGKHKLNSTFFFFNFNIYSCNHKYHRRISDHNGQFVNDNLLLLDHSKYWQSWKGRSEQLTLLFLTSICLTPLPCFLRWKQLDLFTWNVLK